MSATVFSRRLLQATNRRLVAANPSSHGNTSLSRLSAPVAIATGQHFQIRAAATSTLSPKQGEEILAAQRRNRPVSPHLSIYRPQVTWYPSMFNRITGALLSGSLYIFGSAYLAAPLFGWHLESATLAASFASLPILSKVGIKAFFAWPFTFHSLNGIRHLVWDTGRTLTNKQVAVTGWTVIGLSFVSAVGLAFW